MGYHQQIISMAKTLLPVGVKKASCVTKPVHVEQAKQVVFNFKSAVGDVAEFSGHSGIKLKMFSSQEIAEMKPSYFKKVLEHRIDIPQEIKENILSPEKLNLYDTLLNMESLKELSKEELAELLKRLFSNLNNRIGEAGAQLEIIPALLNKGYSLATLVDLPITRTNMQQIELLLLKKCELVQKMWKHNTQKLIKQGHILPLKEPEMPFGLSVPNKEFEEESIKKILRYLNNENAKYLDECLELTGDPSFLAYWSNDTSKIINEFGGCTKEILDRIFRRHHNYKSVKQILGSEKLTDLTARLLEFKDFIKVKNINLATFDELSVKEKKAFLNAFISAISPKEAAYRSQHHLADITILKSKMKIFNDLDLTSNETFVESYNKIVREMLSKIPKAERKIIQSTIDTKMYRRAYRKANPIPTLVDDIQTVLPEGKTIIINGHKIKVTTMDYDSQLGIATHRLPNAEAINIVEALEITDPKMLLCVGTRGGNRQLNFSQNGYAIAIKPRKGCDWHVQAYADIDSGNNAAKNIYNFENIILPGMGNHCNCIDLVPNEIKRILDLSQKEYTQRMLKLKNCTTIQDIEKVDKEIAQAIRNVIKTQRLYEGLLRSESMGMLVSETKPLETICDDILRYCETRGIPLIRVKKQ